MSADMLAALLSALRGVPRLPGAECRHHPPELFDERHPDEDAADVAFRHRQAVALCRACPALAACQQWVESLPRSRRPAGVVAGRLQLPRPEGRPRKRDEAVSFATGIVTAVDHLDNRTQENP